jgi:hypothetical protein
MRGLHAFETGSGDPSGETFGHGLGGDTQQGGEARALLGLLPGPGGDA